MGQDPAQPANGVAYVGDVVIAVQSKPGTGTAVSGRLPVVETGGATTVRTHPPVQTLGRVPA
jgi:hypothetical protein